MFTDASSKEKEGVQREIGLCVSPANETTCSSGKESSQTAETEAAEEQLAKVEFGPEISESRPRDHRLGRHNNIDLDEQR